MRKYEETIATADQEGVFFPADSVDLALARSAFSKAARTTATLTPRRDPNLRKILDALAEANPEDELE